MFPKDSHSCLNEHPYNKTKPTGLFLSFLTEIMERSLHRLAKLLPEPSWIEGKEFLVESLNNGFFIHRNTLQNNIEPGNRCYVLRRTVLTPSATVPIISRMPMSAAPGASSVSPM